MPDDTLTKRLEAGKKSSEDRFRQKGDTLAVARNAGDLLTVTNASGVGWSQTPEPHGSPRKPWAFPSTGPPLPAFRHIRAKARGSSALSGWRDRINIGATLNPQAERQFTNFSGFVSNLGEDTPELRTHYIRRVVCPFFGLPRSGDPMRPPETRHSLIVRLKDQQNDVAWTEFTLFMNRSC